LGIPVRVALEPLVPGVTDARSNLVPLLQGLATVGIRDVTAGYMFLRAAIRDNLVQALEPYSLAESVLAEFVGGPVLPSGGVAPAQYLPKRFRQHGYAALMAIASEFQITVRLSRLTNPDFVASRRPDHARGLRQGMLPRF